MRNAVAPAPVGRITRPVEVDNVFYLFFKRDQRRESARPPVQSIEYSTLRISGSSFGDALSTAESIKARIDTCRDLLSESRRWPASAFANQTVPVDDLTGEYAIYLATLDTGELKTVVPIGADDRTVELLMLCERNYVQNSEQAKSVLVGLRTQQMESHARNHLSKLRMEAIIRR